jgi:hypothetical protein
MPIVHHDRVAEPREMQTDLMHPTGGDLDANQGRFRKSLGDRELS